MKSAPEHANATAGDDPRLVRAAQEYLADLEAGRRPERGAFLARYPELGDTLTPFLDAIDMFHAAGPSAPAVPRSGQLPMPLGEPLGDFRIVREIGQGGMGTVYEAVQLSLSRRVALKVLPFAAALDAKQLQRFKNEAQAAAQLHHTNIVPVYGVGCERGVHYYAMQLIEGQNLADTIRQLRPTVGTETTAPHASAPSTLVSTVAAELSTKRATRSVDFYRTIARLAIQAADALEHAHQLGVIHRDIKPANILVDALGTVWITDFGLAQYHARAGLTRTGDLLGTLRYMSPEQAAGQVAALDPRTDIYALGATLYEMLTLQPMFDGDDHARLLHQILHDEPRPPRAVERTVPAELETIVLKAVSKSPADRYASARDFADDLRRFVENRPILARRPTLAQRVRKWGRRHPTVVVASVVLLILVAAGSALSAALIQAAYHRERQRAEEAVQASKEAEAQSRIAQRAVKEMIQIGNEELADIPQLEGLRRRLLMSTLVYYQEFIDRRQGDPAAQEELRETKARVESLIADLAVMEGAGLVNLLGQPSVLDDLNISGEERKTISDRARRLGDEGRDLMFREFGKLAEDERRRRFLEQARAEDAAINTLLAPEQIRRLRQIALQLRGVAAFRSPEVIDALKLTSDQRRQIRSIESEMFFGPHDSKRPPDDKRAQDDKRPPKDGKWEGKLGGEDFRKGHRQKQKAALQRVLTAVLSADQVQAWRDLTGPRFEGEPSFPPMPFPNMFDPGKGPGGKGKGPGKGPKDFPGS